MILAPRRRARGPDPARQFVLMMLALLPLLGGPLVALPGTARAEEPVPVSPVQPGDLDAGDSEADDGQSGNATSPDPVIRTPLVQITAARVEQNVLDTPGNVTTIDREKIERSGARDLPDLLRREAGLYVTNTTTNREGSTVEARGFNNGGGNGARTLVLVDGRRVNEEDSGQVDWSFLTLDNVDRVEIVRGPVSAAYGDNALAGVNFTIGTHQGEFKITNMRPVVLVEMRVDGALIEGEEQSNLRTPARVLFLLVVAALVVVWLAD